MTEQSPVYRVKPDPLKMADPSVGKTSVLPARIFLDLKLKPATIRVLGLLASVAGMAAPISQTPSTTHMGQGTRLGHLLHMFGE